MALDEKRVNIENFLTIGAVHECLSNFFHDEYVIFFDEGLVQRSTMFINKFTNYDGNKNTILNYLENIPVPNVIIYLKTEPMVCLQRMMVRRKGLPIRLKKYSEAEVKKTYYTLNLHFEEIKRWSKEKRNSTLIEVDNNDTIDCVLINLRNNFNQVL